MRFREALDTVATWAIAIGGIASMVAATWLTDAPWFVVGLVTIMFGVSIIAAIACAISAMWRVLWRRYEWAYRIRQWQWNNRGAESAILAGLWALLILFAVFAGYFSLVFGAIDAQVRFDRGAMVEASE